AQRAQFSNGRLPNILVVKSFNAQSIRQIPDYVLEPLSQRPKLLINFSPREPATCFPHLGVSSFGLSDGYRARLDHLFDEPERAMDVDALCLPRGPQPSITCQQR